MVVSIMKEVNLENCKIVLDVFKKDNKQFNIPSLARRLNWNYGTAERAVLRLVASGSLTEEWVGGTKVYTLVK